MNVQELIDMLEELPPDMPVRHARWDCGYRELGLLSAHTILTDKDATIDLTDKERESDNPCLILY